jgi:Domain of unknown function (DUF6916)
MANLLTADDFAPHIGKIFRPAGQPHALTFVALERHEHHLAADAMREPFTLILRGPRDPLLAEGLYRFAVEDSPGFELYVIPIATGARGHQDYQVVFN